MLLAQTQTQMDEEELIDWLQALVLVLQLPSRAALMSGIPWTFLPNSVNMIGTQLDTTSNGTASATFLVATFCGRVLSMASIRRQAGIFRWF